MNYKPFKNQKTMNENTLFDLPAQDAPKATENKTTICKSFYGGWTAKTIQEINGQSFEITTTKRHGGLLATTAQECQVEGEMVSFMMFGDKNHALIAEKVNCTEAAVRRQHYQALTIFEQKVAAGEIKGKEPQEILKVGQICRLDHPMDEKGGRLAVYELNGNRAKLVNLDTFEFSTDDHIRPVSKKFGIGIYFKPGEMADPIEIGEAIKKTRELIPIREAAAKKAAEDKAEADRNEVSELKTKYPYLTPLTGDKYSRDNKKTKMDNIRAILRANFPGIRFSVVNPHYGTVNVTWEDGPTTGEVDKLLNLFCDHVTDYSGDFRDPKSTNFTNTFGGTNYLFSHRNMNKETEQAIISDARTIFENDRYDCHNTENLAYRIYCQCSIPAGAKVTGIEKKEDVNGGVYRPDTFYKIAYTLPEVSVPVSSTPEINTTGVQVRHNEAKNGIEIRFNGRPSDDVLNSLKANGWRWSRFGGLWYNTFSNRNMDFARSLTGEQETDTDQAAGTIQAQEEAYFDNFCMNNNI